MNRTIRRLQPEADVYVRTAEGRERQLTVVGRGTPDWMDGELTDAEIGRVLEGYGTTYLLQGYRPGREEGFPWLHWPSREDGVAVWSVRVVDDDRPVESDLTADDLFWRVDDNDGR